MSERHTRAEAVAFLGGLAGELAEIHRGSDYSLWRGEAKHRADGYLSEAEPFAQASDCWVFSGDGAGSIVAGRFGEWAIDRLVEGVPPDELIVRFERELARNAAVYEEISPVLGIELGEACELAHGVSLVPASHDILDGPGYHWRFPWPPMPAGTGLLVQSYTVTPAFEHRPAGAAGPIGASATRPHMVAREEVRRRFRLACLLGSTGAGELPMSVIAGDRQDLLSAGGTISGRPFAAQPLVAFPADLPAIKVAFAQLGAFAGGDSLTRAIDRLGRSRLAVHPVDRALDLGMAAEIVLMHDHGSSNTEITYKIGSRAAWLVGADAAARAAIFGQIRELYKARSDAAHSGLLSSRSRVDLDRADRLVVRVLGAVLARGCFPDWATLTLGG